MATNIDVLDREVCNWLRNYNTLVFRGVKWQSSKLSTDERTPQPLDGKSSK